MAIKLLPDLETQQRIADAIEEIANKVAGKEDYLKKYFANVKDFGAVGDGVTNDTQAFRDAEDSLPEDGGGIYIPSGTYIVAHRVLKQNITIFGDGESSVLKTQDSSEELDTDCPLRLLADYGHVKDIKIDGNASGNPQIDTMAKASYHDGIGIYANFCIVENVITDNVLGHSIIVWNRGFPLEEIPVGARHHNSIRYCIIKDTNGVQMRNSVDFASTEDVGIGEGYDQNINHNNEIVGCKLLGKNNIVIHTGWDVLIYGNFVKGGIGLHTNCRRVMIENNHVTDTISVQGGLADDVDERRSRDVSIIGNLCYGNTSGRNITANRADRVLISNNQCHNSVGEAIASLSTKDIIITNNFIHGHTSHGIFIQNSEDVNIEGNDINCKLTISGTGVGINVIETSSNINIQGNKIYGGAGRGIIVSSGVSDVVISDNDINDVSNRGVLIYPDNTVFKNNIINHPTQSNYAVWLYGNGIKFINNVGKDIHNFITLQNDCANTIIMGNVVNLAGAFIQSQKEDTIRVNNVINDVFEADGGL